ncbi:glycosyltransferase [Patescibacteria group bacterium]|nr:glycosyltransferase [Patescibacteria group bacterium]
MSTDTEQIKQKINSLRVAIVHDYLVQDGGAERVFTALKKIFPSADIHVLIHNPKRTHSDFKDAKIKTAFLNNWPFAKRYYQWYLPLLPLATEHLNFNGYDLILSSSSSFAKGIIVPATAKHICYLHTPTRFLWEDRIGYLADLPQPALIRAVLPPLLHRLRGWDYQAAQRPDLILTNSVTSQIRIKRHYRRDSQVIHPPVDTHRIPLSRHEGTYWLTGGRLVPYKRFDLIVKAFNKLNMPLIIFGTGPELKNLKKLASKKTKFVGQINDTEKTKLYRYSSGFIHPQIEDFGITAIEAMSAGRPVIAYGKGGASETILPGITGTFIDMQTWEDIGDAVIRHKKNNFDPVSIRKHAETFSHQNFENKLLESLSRFLNLSTQESDELALLESAYAAYLN